MKNEFTPYMGIDESGKGDYFGPLVVGAVEVRDKKQIEKLKRFGVRDSKLLTDKAVNFLAKKIIQMCRIDIVMIKPKRYNELYKEIGNLNKILAWGHARVLENLLENGTVYAISDKFADENLLKKALMSKGKKIILEQKIKGESFTAVAAASIIARYSFLKELEMMSKIYGIKFNKGSSNEVIETAKLFFEKYGKEKLGEVAKLHFKITQKIIKNKNS